MSRRSFEGDLIDAQKWEKSIALKIEKWHLRTYHSSLASYDNLDDIKRQRNGIDFTISSEKAGWEVKTRANKYYLDGILLETVSVVEKKIAGWLYTSKSKIIVYVWQNESSTNLMPIGYFINLEELRKTDWYQTVRQRYFEIHPPGSYWEYKGKKSKWSTKFVVPPIDDFPEGTLFKFNALLPSNLNQSKLGGSK